MITTDIAAQANDTFWRNYGAEESFVVPDNGTRAMQLALETVLPAIRAQITEQIAAAIENPANWARHAASETEIRHDSARIARQAIGGGQ